MSCFTVAHQHITCTFKRTPEKGGELLKESVQQEWVSYPEAERYSGLSHTTLWRYVNSGDLKAARVGRSVRIHLPTLRQFMEAASDEATGK
jgi:excisionase family DNA binding protein